MIHLAINDLSFLERLALETDSFSSVAIVGGVALLPLTLNAGSITPTISTAAATGADTRLTAFARVSGSLATGFKLTASASSSAASAQASAASIGGTASATVFVRA